MKYLHTIHKTIYKAGYAETIQSLNNIHDKTTQKVSITVGWQCILSWLAGEQLGLLPTDPFYNNPPFTPLSYPSTFTITIQLSFGLKYGMKSVGSWMYILQSILQWQCKFQTGKLSGLSGAVSPNCFTLSNPRLKLPLSKPSRYQASTVNCWLMESKFIFTRPESHFHSDLNFRLFLCKQRNVKHTN